MFGVVTFEFLLESFRFFSFALKFLPSEFDDDTSSDSESFF